MQWSVFDGSLQVKWILVLYEKTDTSAARFLGADTPGACVVVVVVDVVLVVAVVVGAVRV